MGVLIVDYWARENFSDTPLQVGPGQQKVMVASLAGDAYVRPQASNCPQVSATGMGFFHAHNVADF